MFIDKLLPKALPEPKELDDVPAYFDQLEARHAGRPDDSLRADMYATRVGQAACVGSSLLVVKWGVDVFTSSRYGVALVEWGIASLPLLPLKRLKGHVPEYRAELFRRQTIRDHNQ